MPRLSIVVPYLGNLKFLEDTLVSVLANRPEACQVVVVLNESYDDPYELHKEVSFVASRPDAGLLGGICRGLRACEAPIVHLLACGMEVAPDWTDAALAHFDDPRVGAVAPLVVSAAQPHRVVSAGLAYDRSGRVRRISEGYPITQVGFDCRPSGADVRAAFYRRSALAACIGGDEGRDVELLGIDLALALRHEGFHCVLEPECQVFAQPVLARRPGAFRTGVEEARLFWRWAAHRGWWGSLVGHAAMLVGECFMGLVWPPHAARLAGHLAGGFSLNVPRRHNLPATPAEVIQGPHFRRTADWRQPDAAMASRDGSASNFSEACSSGPAAPRRAPG